MKKIVINALLTGSVLAGTAGFATAQTAGDVSMNKTISTDKPAALAGGYSRATFGAKVVTRDFYNKKGNRLFTIAYYDEKGLPAAVRSLVKSVYYDYTIVTVEEVRLPERKVYLVDLQDDTSIKTVRVADDEMEEVRSLVRGDRTAR